MEAILLVALFAGIILFLLNGLDNRHSYRSQRQRSNPSDYPDDFEDYRQPYDQQQYPGYAAGMPVIIVNHDNGYLHQQRYLPGRNYNEGGMSVPALLFAAALGVFATLYISNKYSTPKTNTPAAPQGEAKGLYSAFLPLKMDYRVVKLAVYESIADVEALKEATARNDIFCVQFEKSYWACIPAGDIKTTSESFKKWRYYRNYGVQPELINLRDYCSKLECDLKRNTFRCQ